MQGVALFIGVKTTTKTDWAKVFHADMWGLRKHKFDQLSNDVNFTEVSVHVDLAYFIPVGDSRNYDKGLSVANIFTLSTPGVKSGNDDAAILFEKNDVIKRLDRIKNAIDEEDIMKVWGKLSPGQTVHDIQDDALADGDIVEISFRPFDTRWTYYTGKSGGWHGRPRNSTIMGHMMNTLKTPAGRNVSMSYNRNDMTPHSFAMISVSDKIIDNNYINVQSCYMSPLYSYDEVENSWKSNIDINSMEQLAINMSYIPKAIEVFDYIYGVLHDPIYRERFNEFLKRDFPRVPIINVLEDRDNPNAFYVSEEMFRAYVAAGERLRNLHLMQEKIPATLAIEPNNSENMEIDSIKYKDGVLSINKNKQIHGIPEDVWNYRIGGYQVLDKWFKSHKGEILSLERFTHIEDVVGLLMETIKIQDELRSLHRRAL
jgi:predicted helicase